MFTKYNRAHNIYVYNLNLTLIWRIVYVTLIWYNPFTLKCFSVANDKRTIEILIYTTNTNAPV